MLVISYIIKRFTERKTLNYCNKTRNKVRQFKKKKKVLRDAQQKRPPLCFCLSLSYAPDLERTWCVTLHVQSKLIPAQNHDIMRLKQKVERILLLSFWTDGQVSLKLPSQVFKVRREKRKLVTDFQHKKYTSRMERIKCHAKILFSNQLTTLTAIGS